MNSAFDSVDYSYDNLLIVYLFSFDLKLKYSLQQSKNTCIRHIRALQIWVNRDVIWLIESKSHCHYLFIAIAYALVRITGKFRLRAHWQKTCVSQTVWHFQVLELYYFYNQNCSQHKYFSYRLIIHFMHVDVNIQ